jgi:hypothetical protein
VAIVLTGWAPSRDAYATVHEQVGGTAPGLIAHIPSQVDGNCLVHANSRSRSEPRHEQATDSLLIPGNHMTMLTQRAIVAALVSVLSEQLTSSDNLTDTQGVTHAYFLTPPPDA